MSLYILFCDVKVLVQQLTLERRDRRVLFYFFVIFKYFHRVCIIINLIEEVYNT